MVSPSVPKAWPSQLTFLNRPKVSKQLPPKCLEVRCDNTDGNEHRIHDIETVPEQSRSQVNIMRISSSFHPAHQQYGLFASRRLAPDAFVILYLGYVHGPEETDQASNYDLCLDRAAGLYIDAASMGNEARFINDYRGVSDSGPNAEFRDCLVGVGKELFERRIGVFVLSGGKSGKRTKGTAKGEEILYCQEAMPPTYFITGASGGLGSGVLQQLLTRIPSSSIIASSGRAEAAQHFLDRGIQFRQGDYNDLDGLTKAFDGVDHLLFASANTYDNELRNKQHRNIINAAKAAGVKHTWYTSLAWGGYRSDSKIDVQSAHYETERMLRESNILYTSIREGMYADSFPIFLNYGPTTKTIYLPRDGSVAYAARSDLGEATANLMLQDGHDNEIVLLSGPRTHTLRELAGAVNDATGRSIKVEELPLEQYVETMVRLDEAKKPAWFFEKRATWYKGMSAGDGATVSNTLRELLGREPMDGLDCVKHLLAKNPQYVSHSTKAKHWTRFARV
ncbi:MAG: hypothetical protein M1828_006859 [Chrysothrix sp. TS-e1954]|nr:MAG: hypothetical protein M1828_006859 [Chrysothrix sp. TS-e1954]